jgi:hypothetical protein
LGTLKIYPNEANKNIIKLAPTIGRFLSNDTRLNLPLGRLGLVSRAYDEKGVYKGQNEGNTPFFGPQKNSKSA